MGWQLSGQFPLASGGSFTTVKPSQHSRTAADIIERFTGRVCRFDQGETGVWTVRVA